MVWFKSFKGKYYVMRIFSEVLANDILPIYRSLLAKELSEKGLSQEKIASMIFVTQPAVSQYLRGVRGFKSFERNETLMELVKSSAGKAGGQNVYKIDEFRQFCRLVIDNKLIPNVSHIEDYTVVNQESKAP